MASLMKILKLSKQLPIKSTNPFFINSVRTAVNANDWAPAPYPKNEEARIKAAQKYNLHPDEYVPHPDDDPWGFCVGDYPDLPLIGDDAKDPYYPYDIPSQKRNFNEILPEEFDMLGQDKISHLGTRQRYSFKEIFFTFFGMMTFFVSLLVIGENYKVFRTVLEKQYPTPGKKHYTFEPVK